MTYQVYILQNPSGTKYIGLSSHVDTRLGQHNSGESKYTKSRGPWNLTWTSQAMELVRRKETGNQNETSKRRRRPSSLDGQIRLIIPRTRNHRFKSGSRNQFPTLQPNWAAGFLLCFAKRIIRSPARVLP